MVELLRDARVRAELYRDDDTEATDCDGAELYGRYEQRPAARRQHAPIHALEVHEPVTSVVDRVTLRQHARSDG